MNKFAALSICGLLCLACHGTARPQDSASNAAATATSSSPPAGDKGNVTIVKNDITPLNGQGAFSYDIELSDGTKLIQSGHTEAPAMGETEPSIVIEGSYAYVAPNGKQISITYIADKTGFHPKGDAIPSQGSGNAPAAQSAGGSSAAPSSAAPAATTAAPAS